MNIGAGSVETWMGFFLIQALLTGAAFIRLFLIPHRGDISRNGKVVAFDGLVFLFLWLLLLLDLFVFHLSPRMEWIVLAALVAAVYTIILSAEFSSHAEVSSFAAGILRPAPNFKLLMISLSAFPILFGIGSAIELFVPVFPKEAFYFHSLLSSPSFSGGRPTEHLPLLFITNAVFAGGVGGEPLWRGVIFSRLRKRQPFLYAALMTGIAQAAWLIPGWLFIGFRPQEIFLISVFFVFVSPIFAWVYERSRRSLLAVIILFGSMMTTLDFIHLSFMTIGTVILFVPAVRFCEKILRRKHGFEF